MNKVTQSCIEMHLPETHMAR